MANEKRLIDANALKELILRRSGNMQNTWSSPAVLLAVECQPTEDAVEVVHGRWIIGTGENALMRGCRMCSVCGEIIKTQYSLYGMFTYCPNCGAKMDGDGNE